jgi:hypothetical protein
MDSYAVARDRWESVITGDDGAPWSLDGLGLEAYIATAKPATLDDIYIAGLEANIDGLGGVLGSAGPTYGKYYGGSIHALTGWMEFDTVDISWLMAQGKWDTVILHEMAHVFGIGTLWGNNGIYSGSGDQYTGPYANAVWANMGCGTGGYPPVETDGGAGNAGGHWDEGCLGNELMSGFLSSSNYLSKLTIASLMDMSYGVDLEASDAFGMANLGSCSTCPNQGNRRLREGRKKNMSDQARANILKTAANHLKRSRANAPESPPEGLVYLAGDFVTIYYSDDGVEVFEMTVTWTPELEAEHADY